jgi:hypothetical protein
VDGGEKSAHLADVSATDRRHAAAPMKKPQPSASQPPRSDSLAQYVDVELRLYIGDGTASPHGYIRARSGPEQRFQGWLGLLGLLEKTTDQSEGR